MRFDASAESENGQPLTVFDDSSYQLLNRRLDIIHQTIVLLKNVGATFS